jgi:hypothetical protein
MTIGSTTRSILSLLVISALVIPSVTVAAADVSPSNRILGDITGAGNVRLRGISLADSGTIFSGDHIQTGHKAYASITLSSGTKAELGADTEFVVSQGSDAATHFALRSGTLGFATSRNPLSISVEKYEATAKAGSHGTLRFYGTSAVGFSVTRGSLTVRDTKSKQSIVFPSGTYLLDVKGTGPIAKLVSTLPTLPSQPEPQPQPQAGGSNKKTTIVAGMAGFGVLITAAILGSRREECDATCQSAKANTQAFVNSLATTLQQVQNPTPEVAALQAELSIVLAALSNPNISPSQLEGLLKRVADIQVRISKVIAATNDASASGG